MRRGGAAAWAWDWPWAWRIVCLCVLLSSSGRCEQSDVEPQGGDDDGTTEKEVVQRQVVSLGTEEGLRRSILQSYDKYTLPFPLPDFTVVKFRITLKHFTMKEDEQSMIADAWVVNEWIDPRLMWNPSEHQDIDKLTFPHDAIWKPDLNVYNSARAGSPITYGNSLLMVSHNGRVLFIPSIRFSFTCVMDLTYWPHDKHNCTMVIGSWVHDGFRLDPQILDDKPELDLITRINEDGKSLTRGWWRLLDSNLTRQVDSYPCCPEPYVTLRLSLLLERDAPAYSWIVKMPAVALSILTVVMFLLPPCAGEKLVFGGLCLILDVMFIAFTSSIVAHSPSHTPLIVELVCQQLLLTVVSVVIAAFTTRLARDPHSSPLPDFVRAPLLLLSTCLCLHNYRSLVSHSSWQASRSQQYTNTIKTEDLELGENGTSQLYAPTTCPSSPSASSSLDYVLLAAALDRLCLVIFVVVFGVNMLSFGNVL